MGVHALWTRNRQGDGIDGVAQRGRPGDGQRFGGSEGVVGQQQCVAVGRSARGGLRTDAARSAADIVDDDGLAQLLTKSCLDDTAKSIDAAPRRPGHDQTDRSGRILLSRTGDRWSGQDSGGQKPGETTARKHRDTPRNATTRGESGAGAPGGLSRDNSGG